MSTAPEIKINDEILDAICSFIHGGFKLIEQDENSEFTYAYLLLLASGIERLQKVVYLLGEYDKTGTFPNDKHLRDNLGHKINDIHKNHMKSLIALECFAGEEELLKKSFDILTELVTVGVDGKRYANFDLSGSDQFDIPTHLVEIVKLYKDHTFAGNADYVAIARKIIKIVLQKYIACLIDLIWYKKVRTEIDIYPVCLENFIVEGYIEKVLDRKYQ